MADVLQQLLFFEEPFAGAFEKKAEARPVEEMQRVQRSAQIALRHAAKKEAAKRFKRSPQKSQRHKKMSRHKTFSHRPRRWAGVLKRKHCFDEGKVFECVKV